MQNGLPSGVRVVELTTHADERGALTELFRVEWGTGVAPVQWNAVSSVAGTLRGVHLHLDHTDYLTVIQGRMMLALCDLRRGAHATAALLNLSGPRCAIVIPTGVAHGFYFPEPSVHVYAVSHYWNVRDELGCRWDDPQLGIAWPTRAPRLSPRDRELPDLLTLRRTLHEADPERFEDAGGAI